MTSSIKHVNRIFYYINIAIFLFSTLCILYWLFSSNRYVSEATILVQNTEQITPQTFDISTFVSGVGGPNQTDQLLLSEHLLSVDMLLKLDKEINLRAHYSDNRWDIASRMWLGKYYLEWFHKFYTNMVSVIYDDYTGVLRIQVQAYEPEVAYSIAMRLVRDGEQFMNEMSHNLARAQVDFLTKQVKIAKDQVFYANKSLINFQNKNGLVSPKYTTENINTIISKLEEQRSNLQTQLLSLPKEMNVNHPTKKSLQNSIKAVEKQILSEQEKLVSKSGYALNTLVEEEQRLELNVDLNIDLYKTALIGLEKGRMDAARMIKQVSILQQPTKPEYPTEPKRIYGIVVTIFSTLLVLGIINILKSIILDHID